MFFIFIKYCNISLNIQLGKFSKLSTYFPFYFLDKIFILIN